MSQIQAANAPLGAPSNAAALDLANRIKGTAGILVILLAARAGIPVLVRLLGMAGVYALHRISNWLDIAVALTAFVFHCIWTYRVVSLVQLRGERPRFSPGLAVGSWFIPFANLAMVPMALTDAWRRIVRTGAGVVVGWWICYIAMTVVESIVGNPQAMYSMGRSVAIALGWFALVLCLATYGLWILMVRTVTEAANRP